MSSLLFQNVQKLRLTFEELDVVSDAACRYDLVQIYEGTLATPLVMLCGDTCTPTVIVPSGSARVTFTTDYAAVSSGFKLNFDLFDPGK